MHQVPEGEDASDERWQKGYNEGWSEKKPTSEDPVYISGWCHGCSEIVQCSLIQAERMYLDALYAGGL